MEALPTATTPYSPQLYPSTQCAAVAIFVGAMTTPPQKKPVPSGAEYQSCAIHGAAEIGVGVPPMTIGVGVGPSPRENSAGGSALRSAAAASAIRSRSTESGGETGRSAARGGQRRRRLLRLGGGHRQRGADEGENGDGRRRDGESEPARVPAPRGAYVHAVILRIGTGGRKSPAGRDTAGMRELRTAQGGRITAGLTPLPFRLDGPPPQLAQILRE